MYLSKLILNPRSRQVVKELEHPYQMHRTIMSGFPDWEGDRARVLFRLDIPRCASSSFVIVQSAAKPDWSHLESGTYLQEPAQCKSFEPAFVEGQVLAFRLRANPTVKSKEHRKRIGLYEEHQQIEWLERKGREAGFRVGTLTVIPEGKVRDTIRRNGSVVEIQFLSTQFEGVLQVLDPDRLRCALAQGIGSAKAFGFGLLSVAPA